MWSIVKRLLAGQGGWMAAIPLVMSAVQMGMGQSAQAKAKKLTHKTGEEQQYQDFLGAGNGVPLTDQQKPIQEGLASGMDAAKSGGLYPAISEAFSQRPNSGEYDAIANQEKNLKNQALNSGARGGLLKSQMFDAAKNAASNKMGVMENARQNALQRAFQTFLPMAPSQQANTAYNTLETQGLGNEAQLGVKRNEMALGGASADAAGSGGGLGSILGGLGGGGGGIMDSIMGLFGGGGGGISNAVGGSPAFSMGGSFSSAPMMAGY